jgi:hypothetical protein
LKVAIYLLALESLRLLLRHGDEDDRVSGGLKVAVRCVGDTPMEINFAAVWVKARSVPSLRG